MEKSKAWFTLDASCVTSLLSKKCAAAWHSRLFKHVLAASHVNAYVSKYVA